MRIIPNMRCKIAFSALALSLAAALSAPAMAEDLMDIYKEAYVKDPVVLQAKADREAAFAAIDEATAALLPQIDVVASLSATRSGRYIGSAYRANNRAAAAGVNLSQALWRHSSWASRTIAQKTAARQDLVYNDALQNLIMRTANAYFNILSARDTLTFRKAYQEALRVQLNEATRRFQVGLIAETDQLQAQADYDLSTAQVIAAENSVINSYEELRQLIGRTTSNLALLDEVRFAPVPVERTRQNILQQAEDNNLSLQAAVIARDIARDNITLAQTGHEPTLDLTASLSTAYTKYSDEIPSSQSTGNYHEGTIGLSFNLPVFHGGAVTAQVEQAEQQYVSASESLELTHRTVVSDVNNGYNNVNAAISSVRAYEQLVKSARSSLESVKAGYEVGTRTMSDVLDATQSFYSAQQNLSTARYNYIISRLSLLYTEGSLTVEDLQAVNRGLIPPAGQAVGPTPEGLEAEEQTAAQ